MRSTIMVEQSSKMLRRLDLCINKNFSKDVVSEYSV
jgi:hypothetical protein